MADWGRNDPATDVGDVALRAAGGTEWTYEVKWDGYRALAIKDGARVQLLSRNQKDLTRDYPAIVAALRGLKASSFVLDGEIVALDAEGRPSFQALQHRRSSALAIVYYAFDLLEINGESLFGKPLEAGLKQIVQQTFGKR